LRPALDVLVDLALRWRIAIVLALLARLRGFFARFEWASDLLVPADRGAL